MQIDRLFEIMYVLLEKNTVTAGELAARLEVSQRTIYRDIETLSTAGMPVYMSKGKGGGISLLPDFVLNKTVLTYEEKLNILSSVKAVGALVPNETGAIPGKIVALLGDSDVDWIEVDFSSWGNADEEKSIFDTLKHAVLKKQKISFYYSNGKGQTYPREVLPLKLGFKGQAWYLYGYCTAKRDNRFFKLSRIKDLSVLDETFNRNAPTQIFMKNDIFKEDYINVKLKLSAKMAFRVYDEFNRYETINDGSFIAEKICPAGDWLFSYIASFGAECEILEPADLRDSFIEKINEILKQYL